MNARFLTLSALAFALTIAIRAIPPQAPSPMSATLLEEEAKGSVVTVSGLDRGGLLLLLGSAQRLVADPSAGVAVAALLQEQMPLIAGLRVDRIAPGAGEGPFRAEARALFPDLSAEGAQKPGYLTKTPSHRIVPAGAPQASRRENSPETTCLFEGFEELPIWWEDGGPWFHYEAGRDNNQGDYFWLDEDCTAAEGSWSASAVFGGDYGQYLNCFDDYDYMTDSWLKYGYWIDCVAGYASARLGFAMTMQSELNYDTFGYYASVDDYDYYGYYYSGDYSDYWYAVTQDLRNFYGLGNLTAYPAFALAFNFYADDQVEEGWGAFVDDISIQYDMIVVDDVVVAKNPFRLKVFGANFQPGAWVYIDGQPVPNMKFKHSGLVVAKGGATLKAMVRVGREICLQVMNPNGNTTGCYYFRY